MGLFDKFKKDPDTQEEQPKRRANPTTFAMFRLVAVGYMGYLYYETIKLYIAGGEDAPSLGFLIGAGVFFIGGAAFIAWLSWREYKRMKAEQEAEAAELRAQAEAEAAAGEDEEYEEYEEDEEAPEEE